MNDPTDPPPARRCGGHPDVPSDGVAVMFVARPRQRARGDARPKGIRRASPEHTQRVRHAVQAVFLLLNVYLGAQFYLWVRYFELGGHGVYVPRPPGVEGWLPIVGLMNTKYWLATGRLPEVHPAAMFLFVAFVLISAVLKRSFCSWLCPIGTLSEWLWRAGRRLFGRTFRLPSWLDVPLRGLKYLLLGFFVVAVGTMSAASIDAFMHAPFGLVADVKLLDFFRDLSAPLIESLALLTLLSMLVQNFWCRYLCPYGALMGIASLLSPLKIRRDAERCVDCGKCARACPAGLPVDRLRQVRSAECVACMSCVAACPVESGLQFALPPRPAADARQRWRRRIAAPAMVAAAIALVLIGTVVVARASDHWRTPQPRQLYLELITHADAWTH
jgi:polyferredoxin